MCSKIGVLFLTFQTVLFRKAIDYVNRCVKIFTDRTNNFSNLNFSNFSHLCCLLLQCWLLGYDVISISL